MKRNRIFIGICFFILQILFGNIFPNTALSKTHNAPVNLEDYIYLVRDIKLSTEEIKEPYFVYENELVEIKVKMNSIINEISTNLTKFAEPLATTLINGIESLNRSEYRLKDFESQEEKVAIEIILTKIISGGYCTIKDKKQKKIVNEIIEKFYNYEPAPLQGEHGSFFAFRSGEIFYTSKDTIRGTYAPINIEDHIYGSEEVFIKFHAIEEPCLIYENSIVEIKVKMNDINKEIQSWTTKVGIQLKEEIESLNLQEYRLDNFENKFIKKTLESLIGKFIFEGNCFIKEKATGKTVDKIIVEYYKYNCGLLCGEAGRLYKLISGDIFYKKIDEVS